MSATASPPPTRWAFRPTEAAQSLGVSRAHLYNMIQRGELRCVKLGNTTLIPASELTRLLGGDAG